MRSLAQVASLVAVSLLGGCYLAHEGAPRPDAALAVDAGAPRDAGSPPRDPGPPRDAGLDAGLRCPLARADWACVEPFPIAPGRPFTLPVTLDACGCCPTSECAVSVDAPARVLRITTSLCDDVCDCVACFPAVAACEVPALRAGAWTVEANGALAMELTVGDEAGDLPRAACTHFAEADGCTREGVLDGRLQRADRVCVAPSPDGGHVVRVTDSCGNCDLEGPCSVLARARRTDDLPSGTDLTVLARRYAGACIGECADVCTETTRTCVLPRLEPGETHRVFVEGGPTLTFVSGSGDEVCVGPFGE